MNPLKTVPRGGWKPFTYYAVSASLYKGETPHLTMLYVGRLERDGRPGPGSCYINGLYGRIPIRERPVAEVAVIEEITCMSMPPSEIRRILDTVKEEER